ncbi:SDR family NAD(P)-dependent oxidoreductase [Emcibacter nanhaiensis]|uniref:SDR family oxidoreductase n=1 Tax=Emcibacter nanhaiensis TaxID=1505037 RepID=A0A501PGC3_9PROT|nr:SDR family oxidoreductase [Emcibacter nanhaiensis]TPD59107.1 SDR family oxidoreductase [Emcibacter nanhaiensis]
MSERPAAVVTGGSAGIGAAICRHLLDAGYDVVSLARGKPDYSHDNLSFREVDLADPDATREVAEELAKDYQVTSLVNNAGVIRPSLIEEVKLEDLDYLTNLHLGAAITLTQAFLPAMKDAGFGRIVNMSSRAVVGLPTRTSYAGTKAAIISMTRTWAMELGRHGITVNAIAPGPIVTDMFTDVMAEDSDQARALAASIPVQRLGNVDDIADATLFFLKPSSGFITGQTLFVCGGSSLGSISL